MSIRARTVLGSDHLHDPIEPYVERDAITLGPRQTVASALDAVRGLPADERVLYFYVVDDDRRLVGVVPVRRLLTGAADMTLDSLMVPDVVAIPVWATVLVACEFFVNRRLLAFPVVDDGGRFVGVVDVSLFTEDVLNLARRSYDEIFQIIGVHATEGRTPWSGFRDRFPWLLCNIGAGLACAVLASLYEGLLDAVVVLALFIPVVLALAESVSIQSLTLTLQGLHSGTFHLPVFVRSIWKEFLTAVLIGGASGAIVGGVAFVWKGQPAVGLVLWLSIWAAMIFACLVGLIFPTVLHATKLDPRIAAGPVVLAAADLATLLFFLNLGRVLLT